MGIVSEKLSEQTWSMVLVLHLTVASWLMFGGNQQPLIKKVGWECGCYGRHGKSKMSDVVWLWQTCLSINYKTACTWRSLTADLKPLIHKPPNGSWTKCAYVWMGFRTCAALFANSSHTVCCEPKFVGFLCERKENCMRRVSLPCTR